MHRGLMLAAIVAVLVTCVVRDAPAQLREQAAGDTPALEQTPPTNPGATPASPNRAPAPSKEKLARIWANEPPLVRLARDKFGADLTETDAKFFTAVAENNWTDLRPSADAAYKSSEPGSWDKSPKLKSDRLIWLCTDPAAVKLVPSRGVWLRGAYIQGQLDLYRCDVPFSLTFYDCLFANGMNIAHAKLQELDIRNCCSAAIHARSVQTAENIYLLTTCVFGGLDFIDSQIGGDFDFSGGLAFHGTTSADVKKKGIALTFHDAKVAGDIKLGEHFRAIGQVRLIGAQVGRSFLCGTSKFTGGGQLAIDARNSHIAGNASFTGGCIADGGVELRHTHIGGDLDCDGARFIAAPDAQALDADMANVGGQVSLASGFHAEGEVRMTNAVVGGDIGCNNGHFLNPTGNALCLDGATIGRSLRIGADTMAATDRAKDLPAGFLSRGTLRMWGTQISQDLLASGAQFEAPGGIAILACNMKAASRVDFSSVKAQGMVNLFSADIEHELDFRCSEFDAKNSFGNLAIWANGIHVRGHVYCSQVDAPEGANRFRVNGVASFQFATIAMHWDLSGAQFINPTGDALEASDCRVGGYVNLDGVLIDGRASFSRAKIDGMWIINKSVQPEKLRLDLRFAHIWVIKDERLSDWPPAGQLQLEGLVYDHFDDDSPLDVNDRLEWLRRQYAPLKTLYRLAGGKSAHRQAPDSQSQKTAVNQSASSGVILAEFDQPATMPAPQVVSPTTPTPAPPPILQTPAQLVPVTNDRAEKKAESVGVDKKSSGEPSLGHTADTSDAKVSSNKDDSTKSDPQSAASPTPPDPTGRRYITQPYTQLASVYRAIGQDEQANAVLVARAERLGELAHPFSAQGLWYRYLGRLIGYGYEPFRAIKIGVAIVLLGALIFAIGAHRNLMAETKLAERVLSREDESGIVSPTYPRFNAIVYSLDVFLPFVDLNQVCYWIPGERSGNPRLSRNCLMHIGSYSLKWSSVLHGYLWFQTLAGWTLCTLLAAAVTGIVQS
jgi:hypothetical protein